MLSEVLVLDEALVLVMNQTVILLMKLVKALN